MSSACAIRLKDRWLVHPELKSVSGIFVASEPYQSLPNDADPIALGNAVRSALALAQRTIPNPPDWKALSVPRLAAAEVKSEAALQRQSQLIRITAEAAKIVLTPTRNGGASGSDKGFHHLEAATMAVASNCTDRELGETLRDALSKCL